jgi:hypothetical protein
MSQRGQASVELIAAAIGLAAAAMAIVQLLALAAAHERAARLADQAAVVLAEGRPLPPQLRREADIRADAGTVTVTVRVAGVPGFPRLQVSERVVLP